MHGSMVYVELTMEGRSCLERGGWAGLLLQCDWVWQVLNKWECSRLATSMAERQQRQRLRALQNNRQLARFVLEGRATGKQLGTGSYGSVEEVCQLVS